MISIHDFQNKGLKKYYGSSKAVYRKSHVNKLLVMWRDLYYLLELHTRTRLVPSNKEFLDTKAIPHYNEAVKRLKLKYPNIIEFNNFEKI
jgi:hypothetical protein